MGVGAERVRLQFRLVTTQGKKSSKESQGCLGLRVLSMVQKTEKDQSAVSDIKAMLVSLEYTILKVKIKLGNAVDD